MTFLIVPRSVFPFMEAQSTTITITMLEDRAKATLLLYLPTAITYMELTRFVDIFLGDTIYHVPKCK